MIEQAGALPRVYADALFQLAKEQNALDERAGEVKVLLEALRDQPRFREILESPKVEIRRKTEFVRAVIDERFDRSLRNLVLLLIEKNRQHHLLAVLEAFVVFHDEEKGRLKAVVTTAVPLSKEASDRLAGDLSDKVGKEILLEEKVDPGIIAGAVLRFGGYIVDGGMRSRLEKMKEDLLTPSEQRGS